MHPTWKSCPLRIRTTFPNHFNLVPDTYFPRLQGKHNQNIAVPFHLMGHCIIEPANTPYVWIPVDQTHYDHVVLMRRNHKYINPPGIQWNMNGKVYDPYGQKCWVGMTDPPGEPVEYSCIEEFGDQNFMFTDLSTPIPCREAYAIFRINLAWAARHGLVFAQSWKGEVICAQPIPEQAVDQGTIIRPERARNDDKKHQKSISTRNTRLG